MDDEQQPAMAWVDTSEGLGVYPNVGPRPKRPTTAEIEALGPGVDEIGLAATGELEPGLVQAIAEALAAIGEGTQAARMTAIRVAQAGDPLGIRLGIPKGPGDPSQPTPERLAKTGAKQVSGSLKLGERDSEKPWSVNRIVQGMYDRKQLDEREYQAAEWYCTDHYLAHRVSGLTMKYGERIGAATPASQLARDDSRDSPEELRERHSRWFAGAKAAIGHALSEVWITYVITEELPPGSVKPMTLEDLGKLWMPYTNRQMATAAGASLVRRALHSMAAYYGGVDRSHKGNGHARRIVNNHPFGLQSRY